MKKILIITFLSSFLLLLSGCNTQVISSDLEFDVNLATLSYDLPQYDKICIPDIKHYCDKDGCKRIKPLVFILYDKINKIVYRCDEKPCDALPVEVYNRGIFTYLRPEDAKELSIKIADDPSVDNFNFGMKNEYIEILNSMLGVFISNGKCMDK
jgi:hypothetical protein